MRSFAIAQGHSSIPDRYVRNILSSAGATSVRFHLGYIGDSAHLKIMRSYFFGLHRTVWEAIGPPGSIHRMPNGSTISIGKQGPSPYNEVPVTGIIFKEAPPECSVAFALPAEA